MQICHSGVNLEFFEMNVLATSTRMMLLTIHSFVLCNLQNLYRHVSLPEGRSCRLQEERWAGSAAPHHNPREMIGWRCCGCWCGTRPPIIILGPVPPASASASASGEPKAKPRKNSLHIAGLVPLALSLTFTFNSPTPSLAIPSLSSPFPSSPSLPTTPFSQSKDLPLGLQDDG